MYKDNKETTTAPTQLPNISIGLCAYQWDFVFINFSCQLIPIFLLIFFTTFTLIFLNAFLTTALAGLLTQAAVTGRVSIVVGYSLQWDTSVSKTNNASGVKLRGKCSDYFLFSHIHVSTSQPLYQTKLLDVVCNQYLLIIESAGWFLFNGQGQNVADCLFVSLSFFLTCVLFCK